MQSVLLGHYRYYGVPRNIAAMNSFRYQVLWLWHRALKRRSQKHHCLWDKMSVLAQRWLPNPKIMHPYPDKRLRVTT